MPYKTLEDRRKNYHKNKERIQAEKREYYQKNKERINARKKKYYHKNKEKICLKLKEKAKQYRTENLDKIRIRTWKRQGIIDGDFPLLEKVFEKETHCWICWKKYNGRKIRKCLDHDWSIKDDSNPRYICCNVCNLHVVG